MHLVMFLQDMVDIPSGMFHFHIVLTDMQDIFQHLHQYYNYQLDMTYRSCFQSYFDNILVHMLDIQVVLFDLCIFLFHIHHMRMHQVLMHVFPQYNLDMMLIQYHFDNVLVNMRHNFLHLVYD